MQDAFDSRKAAKAAAERGAAANEDAAEGGPFGRARWQRSRSMEELAAGALWAAGGGLSAVLLKTPDLLKEIYGDLAKPAVIEVGKALGGALGLGNTILFPLHLLNERARCVLVSNFENYRTRLAARIPKHVIEAAPDIAVPLLERFAYLSDKALCDMFAELLAKASLGSECDKVHPSFITALANLSPDEARLVQRLYIINGFKAKAGIPLLAVRLMNADGSYTIVDEVVVLPEEAQPLPEIFFCKEANLLNSNLINVGFFTKHLDRTPTFINPLKGEIQERVSEIHKHKVQNGQTLQFRWGGLEVTAFGAAFARAALIGPELSCS